MPKKGESSAVNTAATEKPEATSVRPQPNSLPIGSMNMLSEPVITER